jgi:type IV secretory pathway VirB4 component
MNGALAARRVRPSRRPGHRLTTAHAQAAYPFVAADGLGSRGTYVGSDVHGSAFAYCPFELYGHAITSPNMAVFGQLGTAKSSLVKTLALRGVAFGHRSWVTDPKGEYERSCEAVGTTPITLHPGGTIRLNPITPIAGKRAQIGLLSAVTAAMLDRPMLPVEEAALREALTRATELAGPCSEPTIPLVVSAMLTPDASAAERMALDQDRLVDESRDAALALRALCEGELAGMFDASTSPSLDLDGAMVVFDLSRVRNSRALGILMACTNAFQWAVITRMHATAEAAGRHAPKIKRINDEGWRTLAVPGVDEQEQEQAKLARQHGVQNIYVFHRPSDMGAVGDAGSRRTRIVEGLLADVETRVIYRLSQGEVEHSRDLLALNDTEASMIPGLARGQALWKVGQRSFLVTHRISRLERWAVDTDARMT